MACKNINDAKTAKNLTEKQRTGEEGKGCLVDEQLDLSSLTSVREFADRILAREPNVNILVNNAGVMCCPEGRTEDGFETHMVYNLDLNDINYERTPYNSLKAYCVSKAANVLFAKALAKKLQDRGICNVTTYSVHPGVVATGIAQHFSGNLVYGGTWLFDNILSWFLKSPRCGAQTSIYCAVDAECETQSGLYYSECAVASTSKQCGDGVAASKLWELTLEMLNLTNFDPMGKLVSNEFS